jgi:kinetochore protein Mis13/DSN1
VDQLHETLHVSSQLASRTSRDLDSRFNQLSAVLEFNRKAPPVGPAQREIDPRELLRTIAQTDIGRAQEMGDVARMTAREVARLDRTGLQSISGQSGVTALPSTPRTPRRAGTPSKRNER